MKYTSRPISVSTCSFIRLLPVGLSPIRFVTFLIQIQGLLQRVPPPLNKYGHGILNMFVSPDLFTMCNSIFVCKLAHFEIETDHIFVRVYW